MKLHLLPAAFLLLVPAMAQQRANVGDQVPAFAFADFLNGDGRQGIADFYGSPVMIDFWGVH